MESETTGRPVRVRKATVAALESAATAAYEQSAARAAARASEDSERVRTTRGRPAMRAAAGRPAEPSAPFDAASARAGAPYVRDSEHTGDAGSSERNFGDDSSDNSRRPPKRPSRYISWANPNARASLGLAFAFYERSRETRRTSGVPVSQRDIRAEAVNLFLTELDSREPYLGVHSLRDTCTFAALQRKYNELRPTFKPGTQPNRHAKSAERAKAAAAAAAAAATATAAAEPATAAANATAAASAGAAGRAGPATGSGKAGTAAARAPAKHAGGRVLTPAAAVSPTSKAAQGGFQSLDPRASSLATRAPAHMSSSSPPNASGRASLAAMPKLDAAGVALLCLATEAVGSVRATAGANTSANGSATLVAGGAHASALGESARGVKRPREADEADEAGTPRPSKAARPLISVAGPAPTDTPNERSSPAREAVLTPDQFAHLVDVLQLTGAQRAILDGTLRRFGPTASALTSPSARG